MTESRRLLQPKLDSFEAEIDRFHGVLAELRDDPPPTPGPHHPAIRRDH